MTLNFILHLIISCLLDHQRKIRFKELAALRGFAMREALNIKQSRVYKISVKSTDHWT